MKQSKSLYLHSLNKYWVHLSLGLISLSVLGTIAAFHGETMSFLDEWVYLDYLFKIPSQFIVYPGEYIGQDALRVMACSGEIPTGPMGSPCQGDLIPSEFPFNGITSADAYTPLYFWIIWLFAKPFQLFGIAPIMSWRLVNIGWLVAGLFFMIKIGELWKIRKLYIFSAGLLVIGSPFSFWAYTFVSTDAPSFFWGACLLYFGLKTIQSRSSGLPLLAIAPIAVLFKVTNFTAVLGIALMLLIVGLISHRGENLANRLPQTLNFPNRKMLWVPFVMLGVALLAEILWLWFHAGLDSVTVISQSSGNQNLAWFDLIGLASLFTGILTTTVPINGVPGINSLPLPDYSVTPLEWILIAGLIGGLMKWRKTESKNILFITAGVAAIFSAPVLAVFMQLATGHYFDFPARYLSPILPLLITTVMLQLRNSVMAYLFMGLSTLYCISLIISSWLIGHV